MRQLFKIIWLLVMFFSGHVFAQQLPVLTLFDQNKTYYNPGAIGSQEVLTGNFFYRQPWTGQGAYATQFFCAHAPLKNPAVAMGILLEHDVSTMNYTGFHLNYAYRLRMGESRLAMGLKLGVFSASYREIEMEQSNDPSNIGKTFNSINAGFGLLYKNEKIWAGLSVPRLFSGNIDQAGDYKIKADLERYQFFLSGGSEFKVNQDFTVQPSGLFVYSISYPLAMAVNVVGVYKNAFKLGAGYRMKGRAGAEKSHPTGNEIILIVGYNINRQFTLGYSYDMNSSALKSFAAGAHEVQIQYTFGYKVNASNPRGF